MKDIQINKTLAICVMVFGLTIYSQVWALVTPRGTENYLEIATWNVRDFPRTGQPTIDTLAMLIRDLHLDIIGMEEIADTAAFANLLSQLPGWSGAYAPSYSGSILKDGILYRTDEVTVLSIETLFWGLTYDFPRPPFKATIETNLPSGHFDFNLIVLHLKAGSEASDVSRRISAMIRLKDYLDTAVPAIPDHDWIIIGDYNDNLDDPLESNIFRNFLDDSTNYKILTLPLSGNPYWASYPYYNSLIDHIIVTADAMDEYGTQGQTITLRLGDEYSGYGNTISDHRPVMSSFTQMQTSIVERIDPPSNFSLAIYPNPFNIEANISVQLMRADKISLDLYDCLGRKQVTIANEYLGAGNYLFKIDGKSLSSGVYFLRLANESHSKITKVNLIK